MTQTSRMRIARPIAGYAAIISILPYLALKAAWLSGNPIGFIDPSLVSRPGMIAANVLSFGMDFIAVALALTFTHQWGQRAPAWLVLFPMWVATGFLAPAVVLVPVTILAQIVASDASHAAPSTSAMLQPWVGRVVGASFAGQGAALIVAFALYMRTRWADLLQSMTAATVPGQTHQVQVILANVAALMAVASGGLHLVWAFGGTIGLPDNAPQQHLLHGIWGVMCIAGAVGVLGLVHRWGRVPLKLLLVFTWIGAGSLFAWGLWTLVLVLPGITLGNGPPGGIAIYNSLSFVKFTAGLLIGLVTVLLLAERQRASTADTLGVTALGRRELLRHFGPRVRDGD
jgi:hypothetical protein